MTLPVIHLDSQVSNGWAAQVEFRGNLPITIGSPAVGTIYLVEKPTTILFGVYTTYQSGLYIRDLNTGSLSDWRRLNIKVNFTDSEFAIVSSVDESKRSKFDLSLIPTSTTTTLKVPNRDGEEIAIKLASSVIINDESDFIDVGGKSRLENKVYHISDSVTLTKPFDVSVITETCYLIFRSITSYSGTGALFQGELSGTLEINDVGVINTSSQPIFDLTGTGGFTNLVIVRRSGFVGFSSKGFIRNIGANLVFGKVQFIDCGLGLVIKDCNSINLEFDNSSSVSTNSPQLVLDGIFTDVLLQGGTLDLKAGESLFQISKNVTASKVFVTQFPYDISSGADFLASEITGINTVYADNGSGGTRVTSVAHGLTIEQVVVISGTVNYDGTHETTVIDVDNYDIDIAFVADDGVGSFTTGDSNDFLDDTRFEFNNNSDQIDTNEISKYKSLNTIVITPLVIGQPVAITGILADWSSIISRRFITNFPGDPVGTARYIGKSPHEMRLSQRITVNPQGGSAKDITGYVTINGVSQTDSRFSVNTGRSTTLNPEDIILLQTNDIVGLSIANDSDLTLLDVIFVNNNSVKA